MLADDSDGARPWSLALTWAINCNCSASLSPSTSRNTVSYNDAIVFQALLIITMVEAAINFRNTSYSYRGSRLK